MGVYLGMLVYCKNSVVWLIDENKDKMKLTSAHIDSSLGKNRVAAAGDKVCYMYLDDDNAGSQPED